MRKKYSFFILFLSFILSACETTEVTTTTRCDIDIPSVEEPFFFGESTTILAYPMTEKWDTLVEFSGVEAEIIAINKESCEECEECREFNGCTDCDYCSSCQESCETCIHSVDIIVPSEASEEAQLVITNSHGTSDPFPVSMEEFSED